MTTPSTKNQPRFFVSADWSKDPRKRSVYVADLKHRRIQSEARPDWGLDTLLALAERLCSQGSVLVGVDLALGVPRSYWELVLAEPRYGRPATFVNWLARLDSDSGFFDPANTVKDHEQWRVGRPWFHVPPGKGGLTSFTQKACDGFLRRIDRKTKAKPVFTVSGIPGTVGSGTRDFWRELAACLRRSSDFSIWPFDGSLANLLSTNGVVLAETYPGLAYAAALADELPTGRFAVGKTKSDQRNRACNLLGEAAWVKANKVDLGDLAPARNDEDDFDAHLTAAAVLRCYLEETPVVRHEWIDQVAEGSMLLAGPVDPALKAKAITKSRKRPPQAGLHLKPAAARTAKQNPLNSRPPPRDKRTDYRCPIPGCSKVFQGSRGGWDAHVASPRKHLDWYPDVKSPQVRKELFRRRERERPLGPSPPAHSGRVSPTRLRRPTPVPTTPGSRTRRTRFRRRPR